MSEPFGVLTEVVFIMFHFAHCARLFVLTTPGGNHELVGLFLLYPGLGSEDQVLGVSSEILTDTPHLPPSRPNTCRNSSLADNKDTKTARSFPD